MKIALLSSQFLGSFIGGALRNVLSFAMTSTVAGELVLAEVYYLNFMCNNNNKFAVFHLQSRHFC